jgi:hypothetical protein
VKEKGSEKKGEDGAHHGPMLRQISLTAEPEAKSSMT